jgi:hypothetical protein
MISHFPFLLPSKINAKMGSQSLMIGNRFGTKALWLAQTT